MQKLKHLADLEKYCEQYLSKSASIDPRTSPPTVVFARLQVSDVCILSVCRSSLRVKWTLLRSFSQNFARSRLSEAGRRHAQAATHCSFYALLQGFAAKATKPRKQWYKTRFWLFAFFMKTKARPMLTRPSSCPRKWRENWASRARGSLLCRSWRSGTLEAVLSLERRLEHVYPRKN